MNKWLELILGIILIIASLYAALSFSSWGQATLEFLKGGIVIFVIVVGLILVVLGISDMKG